MPGLSQTVLIDSTKQTIQLDKKATIATGNLLEKGAGYERLFIEQERLVDSLKRQIEYQNKQNFQNEFVLIPALEKLLSEVKSENKYLNDNSKLEIRLLGSEVKHQKKQKWNFGVYGVVVGALLTLASFLVLGI